MRKTPMSNDRGETIVEVVAAFLLLLLFIGMFIMAREKLMAMLKDRRASCRERV